jgi:hypothetical protein
MRLFHVFLLILLLPMLYIGWLDYGNHWLEGTPAKNTTIAEFWLAHDRAGFEEFRAGYIGQTEKWNREVLPYLNMKALPLAVVPVVIIYLLALFMWLLGVGPYNRARMSGQPRRAFKPMQEIHRHRASDREDPLRFRRK